MNEKPEARPFERFQTNIIEVASSFAISATVAFSTALLGVLFRDLGIDKKTVKYTDITIEDIVFFFEVIALTLMLLIPIGLLVKEGIRTIFGSHERK